MADNGIPVPVQPNGNAFLQGNYAPAGECDEVNLKVVSGAIPEGLRGTLYRVGPNPRWTPRNIPLYHWFDGDGLVHRIHIGSEEATYKAKFAQTTKYQIEQKFQQAEFGGLRDFAAESRISGLLALGYSMLDLIDIKLRIVLGITLTDKQIHKAFEGTYGSNTNLLHFNDRLFTLEETGLPIEIDPVSLDTIGPCDFDGAIDGPHFTAHPFEDPETGELFTYGYDVVAPYLRYYVLNADGSLRMRRNIDLMFATMMHTMTVTKTKAVVLQFPATFLAENLNTTTPVRWEPEYGARIGVFDRYDVHGPVTWYEIPLCYAFHVMNAYDTDDDKIIMDVARYFRIPLLDLGGDNPSPPLQANPDARFCQAGHGRDDRVRVGHRPGGVPHLRSPRAHEREHQGLGRHTPHVGRHHGPVQRLLNVGPGEGQGPVPLLRPHHVDK